MGDTNRTRLSIVPESTFNVMPSSPAFRRLRWTGESLKSATATKVSDEVRDDRQVSGFYRVGLSVDGSINFEMSFGGTTAGPIDSAFDEVLKGVMFSAGWSTGSTATANVTGPATISAVPTGAAVGMWIRTYGFANPINNGVFKITAVSSTLTVAGSAFVTQTGGNVQLASQIVNGVTQSSYAIERYNADMSAGGYTWFTGNVLNSLAINITAGELITGSFGVMGCVELGADAAVSGATYVAAPTNRSMSAVDDVYAIFEGGVKIPTKSFSLTLGNNARPRMNIGELFASSIGLGEFSLSGSMNTYFRDATLLAKYRSFAESAIAVAARDNLGNSYVFDTPTVKYSDGTANSGGKNADVMANVNWTGYMNATEGITHRISRFQAP